MRASRLLSFCAKSKLRASVLVRENVVTILTILPAGELHSPPHSLSFRVIVESPYLRKLLSKGEVGSRPNSPYQIIEIWDV